jgi:hypothetical protein
LMIQEDDDRRIERLKRRLGIATKIDVVRAGMTLLEQDARRRERLEQWKRAAARVATSSAGVNADFRAHSRLKRP